MASSYPGSLDSFTNPSSTDAMDASAAVFHDVQHSAINDAVEAVQAELGTDPAGNAATVKARLEYNERFASPGGGVWVSGGYATNAISTGNAATFTTTGARVYYFPWWCPLGVTVDRVAIEVTTGQSAANARVGIYSPDGSTGGPGSLLLDAGEIDASAAALQELTVSQALSASFYWLAVLNETSSVALRAHAGASSRAIGVAASTAISPGITHVYEAATYASGFPATASAWGSLTMAQGAFNAVTFWMRRT